MAAKTPFLQAISGLVQRLHTEIEATTVVVVDGSKEIIGEAGDVALLLEGDLLQKLWLRGAVAIKQAPLRGFGRTERLPLGPGRVAFVGLALRRLMLFVVLDVQRADAAAPRIEGAFEHLEWLISRALAEGSFDLPPTGSGGSGPGGADLEVVEAGVTAKPPSGRN